MKSGEERTRDLVMEAYHTPPSFAYTFPVKEEQFFEWWSEIIGEMRKKEERSSLGNWERIDKVEVTLPVRAESLPWVLGYEFKERSITKEVYILQVA